MFERKFFAQVLRIFNNEEKLGKKSISFIFEPFSMASSQNTKKAFKSKKVIFFQSFPMAWNQLKETHFSVKIHVVFGAQNNWRIFNKSWYEMLESASYTILERLKFIT